MAATPCFKQVVGGKQGVSFSGRIPGKSSPVVLFAKIRVDLEMVDPKHPCHSEVVFFPGSNSNNILNKYKKSTKLVPVNLECPYGPLL